jgi:pyruvate dehydrogenase E1 component alpha subunit
MLLESMNLASVWRLPLLFVCKDNGLSITTPSEEVTAGDLLMRAQGLGLQPLSVDGTRVEEVWDAARQVVQALRDGAPPAFILASCLHFEGHFLGDAYLRLLRRPLKQAVTIARETVQAVVSAPGKARRRRFGYLARVLSQANLARIEQKKRRLDPLRLAREQLEEDADWLAETEAAAQAENEAIVAEAMAGIAGIGAG